MKPPTHLDNLLQYTAFTANTIGEIVKSFEIPFLGSAATLVLVILKWVYCRQLQKLQFLRPDIRHTYTGSSYRELESGNHARMKPPTHLDSLLQYTAFAADTVGEIAGSFEIPFLRSATTLVLAILKCVESTKSNKDICIEIVERIHEILGALVKLHSRSEIKGVLPTAVLHDIGKFTEILEKVFTLMRQQQSMGRIKQLFEQRNNAERLEVCRRELNHALEMFKVRTTGLTLSQLAQIRQDAKQCHEELVALLESDSDLTGCEHSSIFHGRDSELHSVVTMLLQDSAHIAILGTGGIGKTTLAIAAIQSAQVESKYSWRYFVSCQSTPTCVELVSMIADHLGLEKQSNLTRRVVHHFTHAPPLLLVLDNFETPWEPSSSRSEVEEFLSLLSDIPQLALVITMRGAERPAKVKWAQPFLPPLATLPHSAALQTFFDVADSTHDNESVNKLLELTGNLPLAVSLIASVAGAEGCDSALTRWASESTRMLSDGYDKRSSLDISIMLSFTSFRMTPGAQDLLSILSMLPDGFTDADLLQAELPIPSILASKSTLLRTALAFLDKENRIQVLPPIREHILYSHPPNNALKLKVHKHFHDLLCLWKAHRDLNAAQIVLQLSRNLGNINRVVLDSLNTECPDMVKNYQSILNLNQFCVRTQDTYSQLLLKISEHNSFWKDNSMFGDYLIQIVDISQYVPIATAETKIMLGNKFFESKHPLEQARWSRVLGLYWTVARSDRASGLEYYQKALALADSTGSPSRVGHQALCMISLIMLMAGNLSGAQKHATRAQEYAEALGDIYPQAESLYMQSRCHIIYANFAKAQKLAEDATQILLSCGLDGSALDLRLKSVTAAVHFLKTEYLQSHHIQLSTAAAGKPTAYATIVANLNIALIDIVCGIDSGLIRKKLDLCQQHCRSLYGWSHTHVELVTDHRAAELNLKDGDLSTANMMFKRCVTKSQKFSMEIAIICLERLADHSTGMNNIQTTLGWAGIFLVLALRTKDKLAIMKAFRCLGQIFAVQGDVDTALSLFNVALDGFTFMDVHRWRADCMVRIADIWNSRREVLRAVGLWKEARPLFERSSQAKDVARIDVKLTKVEVSILENYKRQFLQLAELNVPAEVSTVTDHEKGQGSASGAEDQEFVDGEQNSLQIGV
ncbi:hypothetical protein C8J57DRAFT_1470563 [Mycena rebaudengoi]|nr:hypothetical protein C8J57DRAFT_1470563 [Mycena rebaudengoi]